MLPELNQKGLETFWMFCNERHQIYLNRLAGKPKPWSEDPIFQEWKFCNVFRWLDKQSQLLIDNIIKPHWEDEPSLLLFNIFLFRTFNLWDTYKEIGWVDNWDPKFVTDILYRIYWSSKPFTSGAYMLRGRQGIPKYVSMVMTLTDLWNEQRKYLAKVAMDSGLLEEVTKEIQAANLWGWGPFTSYQVALDLSYSPILADPIDINDWCEFGPGAKRGLEIIWPGIRSSQYLEAAKSLVKNQGMWLKDYMPVMTLQDVEFALCETSKYWRILNGGKSKEKYDGKA